jgi:hypothetical protein
VTGFAPGAGAIPQQMHPPSTVLNTVDQGERNAEPPRAIEVASCSFTASHLSRDLDSPVAQNIIWHVNVGEKQEFVEDLAWT